MHQKLLMNGLVIDYVSLRLIFKGLDSLVLHKQHDIVRLDSTYISTDPRHTYHTDGYDKSKAFGFTNHVAIDDYSRKILWLFVGSSNNNPKIIVYYLFNCLLDLQLLILQFNDYKSIVLQGFTIISKNSPEHLKLQY